MPVTVEAKIAWAIPVPIETLGAHVETYFDLLPTITTLRLCHRFGKGAKISKLPVELLSAIEELLTIDRRTWKLEHWRQMSKCAQHVCDAIDHVDKEQVEQMKEWVAKDLEYPASEDDLEDRANTEFSDAEESWIHLHDSRREEFEARVGLKQHEGYGIFMGSDGVPGSRTRKHFGVDVWAASSRSEHAMLSSRWEEFAAHEATIAYLILPTASTKTNDSTLCQYAENDGPPRIHDGLAMGFTPPKLTRSGRKRFEHALSILGLKPEIHASQKVSVGDDEHAAEDEEEEAWPQLTALVKTDTWP